MISTLIGLVRPAVWVLRAQIILVLSDPIILIQLMTILLRRGMIIHIVGNWLISLNLIGLVWCWIIPLIIHLGLIALLGLILARIVVIIIGILLVVWIRLIVGFHCRMGRGGVFFLKRFEEFSCQVFLLDFMLLLLVRRDGLKAFDSKV